LHDIESGIGAQKISGPEQYTRSAKPAAAS
jgi:hypothetical protein